MADKEWTEEKVRVGDTELVTIKGGKGKPLLVLHGELGWPGWTPWNSALAKERTLIAPIHPGFGKTRDGRLDRRTSATWPASISATCASRSWRPVDVIGYSLGGWIAAEMAAADPAQFSKMILVAPVGMRPPQGEIMDMFTVTARVYLTRGAARSAERAGFHQAVRRRADARAIRGLRRGARRDGAARVGAVHVQSEPAASARGNRRIADAARCGASRTRWCRLARPKFISTRSRVRRS